MRRFKISLCVILSILAIILPLALPVVYAFVSPPQYDNTFVGALDKKLERLQSVEGEKIVVIGGSSVAFGLDSALMEKYTGMPVVNFGLYAALGTKLMLDLSRSGIGEGDIVIVSPELDAQTWSLYFNSKTTLQAFDGNLTSLKYVDSEHAFSLAGSIWNFAASKLQYQINGNKPDPDGVYNSKNFNEYGDLVFERNENVMFGYYELNNLIDPDPDIITDEFVDYMNDYIDYCKSKGATVYLSFAPMNELGVASGATYDDFYEFSDKVEARINCTLLSDITTCLYDPGYFYDTNYHLNDIGVKANTLRLASDLRIEMGNYEAIGESIPDPLRLPIFDVSYDGEDDENSKYFVFEEASNGALSIVGLTELGKKQATLTVPVGYNGKKVIYISEGAFVGGEVRTLILTVDTNIRAFAVDSFKGASTLTDIIIYYMNEADILPPPSFYGASSSLRVHVPKDSGYESGYYWSERGLKFVKDID